MGQIRNKMKYDHTFHSSGGNASIGGSDLYESRHNDVRSPSMHHHHSGGAGLGANNGMNGSHQSHEQMNAMMSMFNPMMAAFIQQLASGIQPNSSQSVIDPNGHVNGASLGHHHAPPPWTNNDYSRNNTVNSTAGLASGVPNNGGYNSSGYNNGNAGSSSHSRFKGEKNF